MAANAWDTYPYILLNLLLSMLAGLQGAILLIAAILFALHWRWLRRTTGAALPVGTTRIDI